MVMVFDAMSVLDIVVDGAEPASDASAEEREGYLTLLVSCDIIKSTHTYPGNKLAAKALNANQKRKGKSTNTNSSSHRKPNPPGQGRPHLPKKESARGARRTVTITRGTFILSATV